MLHFNRWGVFTLDILCTTFLAIFTILSVPLATVPGEYMHGICYYVTIMIQLFIEGFDGSLLSLALTYILSIANQAFSYIQWSCGEVENCVCIIYVI